VGRHTKHTRRNPGRWIIGTTLTIALASAGITVPYWQGRAEATGATPGYPGITGPSSSASGNTSTPITIGNFTLTDASASGTACGLSAVRAVLSTNLGTIAATQPTGGTVTGSGTATVTLTGSISAVESSLDAATLTSTTAGTATITTTFRPNNSQTIGGVGYVFSVTTGHYYRRQQFTSDTWANNRTNASNQTFCGAGGYLATVTTAAENDDIQALSQLGTNTLTMGGLRATNASDPLGSACTNLSHATGDDTNCLWYWVPGTNAPATEQNARFNAYADPARYFHPGDSCATNAPWHSCEPNNSGPVLTNWYADPGGSGTHTFSWDDVTMQNTSWTLVEFGNNTTYSIASVSSTVTVSAPACTVTTTNYTGNGSNGVSGARYRVVTYASGSTASCSGTWTAPSTISSVDLLVIGGGGGGGSSCVGGGGGAGGLVSQTGVSVTSGGSTSITVGAAGPGGSGSGCAGAAGSNGGQSTFGSTSAAGGGGGGAYDGTGRAGAAGASGGGGSGAATAGTVGAGGAASPAGQGNAGGAGGGGITGNPGGGGGGSGSAGAAPSAGQGGGGGAGTANSITGTSVNYAAGGGGATDSGTAGQGGSSCGGNGAVGGATAPTAGTGYGCGGGGGNGSQAGAAGSSGVVIVRYRIDMAFTTTDQHSDSGATIDLAFGRVGSSYSQELTITRGLGPFTYSVTSGSLPAGLSLNGATGQTLTISGTPTAGGASTFTVRVTDTDSNNLVTDQQVTIAITQMTMPSLILVDPRVASLTFSGPSALSGGSNMALCMYASNSSGTEQNASTLRFDTAALGSSQASSSVNGAALTLTNDFSYGTLRAHGSNATNVRSLTAADNALRLTRTSGLDSTFTFAVKAIPYWSAVPDCTTVNDGSVVQVVQVKPVGIQRTVTTPMTVG